MTVEAPLHLQRFAAPFEGHLVDSAMAFDAADALGDVDAVIEVNEIGQLV
jgi:hypothetical protein